MKEKLITASLLQLIKLLVDSDIIDQIRQLVLSLWGDDKAGAAKKADVTRQLHDELGDIVSDMAGWLLSTAIDVVHAYLATRMKQPQ